MITNRIQLQKKTDNKLFWNYVSSKTKTKPNVGSLKKSDGSLTVTDQETANVLNEYFSSKFGVEDKKNLPVFHERNFDEPLLTVEITEEKVLNVLKELKNGKSQGPDQKHPMLLKETKQIQSKLLTTIFKKSLEDSTLPTKWKEANVTAIFKGGDRKLAENYRPKSLTSVPCKLMEKKYLGRSHDPE